VPITVTVAWPLKSVVTLPAGEKVMDAISPPSSVASPERDNATGVFAIALPSESTSLTI